MMSVDCGYCGHFRILLAPISVGPQIISGHTQVTSRAEAVCLSVPLSGNHWLRPTEPQEVGSIGQWGQAMKVMPFS